MKLTCTVTHEAEFDLDDAINAFQEDYEDGHWYASFDDFIQGIVDDYFWPSDDMHYDDPADDPLRAMAVNILKRNVFVQLSMFDEDN